MSKFKVGDRVKIVSSDQDGYEDVIGKRTTIEDVDISFAQHPYKLEGIRDRWGDQELELIKKVKEPTKQLFRLKKDTLDHKKGTIVKEQCTDGDQDFDVLDSLGDTTNDSISREKVVDNPKWFEEVKIEYVPVAKATRKKKAKKSKK